MVRGVALPLPPPPRTYAQTGALLNGTGTIATVLKQRPISLIDSQSTNTERRPSDGREGSGISAIGGTSLEHKSDGHLENPSPIVGLH